MAILSAAVLGSLPVFAISPGQSKAPSPNSQLERDFETASSEYEAGHYAEAAARLEKLARAMPRSFEIHELLAMTYSAESLDDKASEHFETAVRLHPSSAAAHVNLAANLVRLRKPARAEQELRQAVKLEPRDFEANHDLGELLAQSGKLADAVPFLERAQKIDPSSYGNGYDLAFAYVELRMFVQAREQVQTLLKQKDNAELHNLLAQIEEKEGSYLDAVNEYEKAAHMEPSESNLFDWGSELLMHRTLEPAIEVLRRAAELYPNSQRIAIGYGIALYSRGNYDEAVRSLIRAADLNPSDARSYLFLSRAYDSSPGQADEVVQRFRRFSELQPQNGLALYYYAMSLWKGKRTQDAAVDLAQIESLLKKAVELDPALAEAHLQLGNLYSDQGKYADAVPQYEHALQINADLADAHYRLGQAYVHTGDKAHAQDQFAVYQKLRSQQMADLDKQRADVRQFVYSEQEDVSSKGVEAAKP